MKLDDIAKAFHRKHSKRLRDEGLLRPENADSFDLLCLTYSLIQQLPVDLTDRYYCSKLDKLVRNWQNLGKQFGLFSKDKPKSDIKSGYQVFEDEE